MKVYEAVYVDRKDQGVYGISLVENPAMQDEWIALSEQKQDLEFSAIDEKRRLLLGAVLIPDKKIYRNIGGNEFYITFNNETIGNLAHDFIKNGFQNNSSEEHKDRLTDVSFVESWQVEDSATDKSALYGKSYPKGTWVTMAKVSDDIYEKATNGTFKGFSIDALLSLQEINLNTNIEMTEEVQKNIVDKVIDGVKALFNTNELETTVETPTEVEVQPEVVETVEEPTFDAEKFASEVLEKAKAEFNAELETKLAEKDKEIKELKTELSKQPETEPIKDKLDTVAVELNADGRFLEFLRENNNKN